MMVDVVAKQTKPLCFLPSGKLVAYRNGDLLLLSDKGTEEKHPLIKSKKETLLGHSKLLTRLLRLGFKQAIALDEDHVILSVKNVLYEYCFSQKTLSNGFVADGRIRPLYFTEIKDIEGFDDGIIWGGYQVNMDKGPVHIYRRTGTDKWEIAYTFEKGKINHIHNIISDPYRKCLWVFTGDFGEAAAIWKITENFQKVERVVCDDQHYRACVAFALPEGILYATDTPFADNFIYIIRDISTMKRETIAPLSGSCIYGCRWNDQYVFASTVEGDRYGFVDVFFKHDLGAGIKDNFAHLYIGNLANGFQDVYKGEKDRLPYIFQFAAFMFPTGTNNSSSLFFYPMGTKENDLNLMRLKK